MNMKVKGTICGIIAAVSYGTNPLGALSLYQEGYSVTTVLFYRYLLAALILLFFIGKQRETLKLHRGELAIVALLGVLFSSSSITLFTSFHYMDAGIASTLLFVYPIMVAVLMALLFKEKITLTTFISIILALLGIYLVSNTGGSSLNSTGVILVFISALTYAFYMIVVNKSKLKMSVYKLNFYVLTFCLISTICYSFTGLGEPLQLLTTLSGWSYAFMLAIVPTVISLVAMTLAIQELGSTPTAVMGALEPLTAVVIGVTLFGETLSFRELIGIFIILASVLLIITGNSLIAKINQHFPLKKRPHLGVKL